MSIDVAGFKEGQKAMWTAGDYPEVARRIEMVGRYVAERAGAAPGVELLDVATGAGNVSIPAAEAGAVVTGLDLTPKLLEVARQRAAAAGVAIELIEGDAEELPFDEASFDRATSCFGVMFAPRHEVAARELVRVVRPGGRIVVTAWTPEGFVGRNFQAAGSYMPAPPPQLKPPVMWGTEDHVRELFAGTRAELSFERRSVTFAGESPEAWLADDERLLGPAVMAKAALESQGRYEDLRRDMLVLYDEVNEAGDGSFRVASEYLVSVAELPA
ncbi:MAG TPA: methyltransferase domain-containing protein [Solirubrobacteraceae bacterium]|jgi:ubiquinone/menaquinone biosynthesis C-methylase UbiE